MNSSSQSEAPTPSATEPKRSPWARLLRFLRVLLGSVVALATLIALFYLEEGWRGQHAWNAYAKQMTERGEVFDYKAVLPPPVPDDQNLAMTPFLAPLFDFLPGTQTWRDTNATQRTMQFGNKLFALPDQIGDWHKGQRTDWPACEAALAAWHKKERSGQTEAGTGKPPLVTNVVETAGAVVAALNEYEPVLAELRTASRRPHSRFGIRYEEEDWAGILLPHLAIIKKYGRILSVRASAELLLGQPEPALADLNLALDLTDTMHSEPFLISHLVRCAIVQLAMQPVWEGLADHKWTEPQLQALQQRLEKFDFLADSATAMRGERACGNNAITYLRRHPVVGFSEGDNSTCFLGEAAGVLMPRGWLYLEQVNYNRLFSEVLQPGVDYTARRLSPKLMQQHEEMLVESIGTGWSRLIHHRLMAAMLLPALTKAQVKFAGTQTVLDEAVLACALERHRLANGRYPDSLAELAPRFVAKLPHDLITGEPLKYRQTDNGRFVLYSVGWNETDDGGKIALTPGKSPRLDSTQGDWVWPSP